MELAAQRFLLEEDCTDTQYTSINLELEGAGVVRCLYHWQGSEEWLEVFEDLVKGWGPMEKNGRAGEVRQGTN